MLLSAHGERFIGLPYGFTRWEWHSNKAEDWTRIPKETYSQWETSEKLFEKTQSNREKIL